MNKTKSFVHGTLLLTVAGIVTKFINMFFKVPLQALTGDEGLAFYYNPYPFYTLFIAILITGISSSVSKIVSEKLAFNRYREAHTIFKYNFIILVLLGLLSSILLYSLAEQIVDLAGWDPRTIHALRGMAISPVLLAVIGAIRGYFQGMQNMFPSAMAQILESIGKVIFGIGLVVLLLSLDYDISIAAGGAAVGLTIGVFLSMIYLIFVYMHQRKAILEKVRQDKSKSEVIFSQVIKAIFDVGIPIAIGAASYTVMNFIDSLTIVRRLTAIGLDFSTADGMLGQKIKADTFINIPMIISVSLVISILPAISQAVALNDSKQLKEKIDISSKLVYLIALPASIGIFILAEPLLKLFFFSDPSGSEVLAIYSFSIIFIIMAQTFTAVLQGISHPYIPLVNLLIACSIKVILNMTLINNTFYIKGAVISSGIAYVTLAILNYIAVKRQTGYGTNGVFLIKGLLSTLIMGILTYGTYSLMKTVTTYTILQIAVSVTVGILIYSLCIIKTRVLDKKDFQYLPQGQKVYKIIDKIFYRGR